MRLVVSELLQDKENSTIHRFEQTGLGLASFNFTGEVTEKTYQACSGALVQADSTCDYCGTCIRYEFWVCSADGKEFKVGCDCIHKTGDNGLIQQISLAERKLRDMKVAAAKVRKHQRLETRIAAAKKKLSSISDQLASKPHPNTYFAQQGKTLLDYVDWCFTNHAGDRASFIIERLCSAIATQINMAPGGWDAREYDIFREAAIASIQAANTPETREKAIADLRERVKIRTNLE